MTRANIRLLSIAGLATVVCIVASATVFAQDRRDQGAVASAPTSGQMSVQSRRQTKQETARLAGSGCGDHCADGPDSRLAYPADGGATRYTCNSGNCACSGACQCVAMEEICMPDTLGCSDYGCTCKKKADAEPTEPNC